MTILAFLFALTVLIFVHELGHYAVARACGVKVLRFSIGFGRPLLRWRMGADRTEWVIAAIPLGGYVRMLDERDEEGDSRSRQNLLDVHRSFNRQSLSRRSAIVAAGPMANFLLAIAIYAFIAWTGVDEPAPVLAPPPAGSSAAQAGLLEGDRLVAVAGRPVQSMPEARLRLLEAMVGQSRVPVTLRREGQTLQLELPSVPMGRAEIDRDFMRALGIEVLRGPVAVASVVKGSRAESAGLQPGDEIVGVDGLSVSLPGALVDYLRARPEREIVLTVRRGALEQQMAVVPASIASERAGEEGRLVGRLGASLRQGMETVTVRHGPLGAVAHGAAQTWDMSWFSLRMLGRMITGDLSWKNLSGPVTIADYAGQTARVGWVAYLTFLALVSVSLGVLNLLPVPVLDGGHLVYYGLEAIRGRPLSERMMAMTQRLGFAVIGTLMFVAIVNDLTRLWGG